MIKWDKLPIIVSAPHSYTTVPSNLKSRIALTEYELWQMSDPFTDQILISEKYLAVHIARIHRALGDLCRDKQDEEAFRLEDFWGRAIWNVGAELNEFEREHFIKNHWETFHQAILDSFAKANELGFKKVLYVDHHNTSSDHFLGDSHKIVPPVAISNLGDVDTGEGKLLDLSLSKDKMEFLQKELELKLNLEVAINYPWQGSFNLRWLKQQVEQKFPEIEFFGVLLEWNRDLVWNPISKQEDKAALSRLNQVLEEVIEVFSEEFLV